MVGVVNVLFGNNALGEVKYMRIQLCAKWQSDL